jgi:uncharacterized protein
MKNDIKTLIIGMAIIIIAILINLPYFFDALSLAGIDTGKTGTRILQSRLFQFKNTENKVWASVKGTNTETPIAENNVVTPTPRPTLTPEQIAKMQQEESDKLNGWQNALNFLVVGDSMMLEGFGPRLESDLLTYSNVVDVSRYGKYSTGLNRIDYFDWFKYTDELITKHQPNAVIVMFGANDGQDILDDNGVRADLFSPEWDIVYAQRVHRYMDQVSARVKKLYFVGHPIAKTQEFQDKFKRMNAIYEKEAKNFPNVVFIPTWDRFTVDGKYAPYVADDDGLKQVVKASDGVHVTAHGGKILSSVVIKALKADIKMVPK